MKYINLIKFYAFAGGIGLAYQASAVTVFNDSLSDGDYNNATNWTAGAPGSNDTNAVIQTTEVATTSANYTGANAYALTVRGSGAVLNVGHDLTNVLDFNLSNNDGAFANVNQTNGTITARRLNAGNATAAVGSSTFSLDGGTFSIGNSGNTVAHAVGTSAVLDIDGGILEIVTDTNNQTLQGAGSVNLRSGTLTTTGTDPTDLFILNGNLTVSGGLLDINGQFSLQENLTISGDAATIAIDRFNSATAATLAMNFDDTGVSTIVVSAFSNLGVVDLLVDGSAYNGSETSFDLLTSGNNTVDLSGYSVTGFGVEGIDWELIQGTGGITLNLIPEPSSYTLLAGLLGLFSIALRRR